MIGQRIMRKVTPRTFAIAFLTCLIMPAVVSAQDDSRAESWPETKQRMIERGLQFDSAWTFYETLEAMTEDRTLSLEEVPDWSGLWERSGPVPRWLDSDQVGPQTTAALKGEYAAMFNEILATAEQGRISDPHSGCGQARGYPGMLKNGRPHEFAVTPHQTWHLGQARNEVRRIYTDGRGHTPEDWAYETEHGDSIGFWDGQKLITHTMYTNGGWIGRVQPYFSTALESIEIWQKTDEETIQVDVWIYDSEALEVPWYTRQMYKQIHQQEGSPLRLEYWWNCHSQNNIVVETEDGGTTFLDFDFTDLDDQ